MQRDAEECSATAQDSTATTRGRRRQPTISSPGRPTSYPLRGSVAGKGKERQGGEVRMSEDQKRMFGGNERWAAESRQSHKGSARRKDLQVANVLVSHNVLSL